MNNRVRGAGPRATLSVTPVSGSYLSIDFGHLWAF
jgi:hypothetical protein